MEQTRNTTTTHFEIQGRKKGRQEQLLTKITAVNFRRKGTTTYQNNSITLQNNVIFIL
jgi:hypothetical protein